MFMLQVLNCHGKKSLYVQVIRFLHYSITSN